MKRFLTSLAAVVIIGAATAGCSASPNAAQSSSPAESSSAAAQSAPTLTKEGGLLVDQDPTANVVEGAGFKISIDPTAKTASFQQIDPDSGELFRGSSLFDYSKGSFIRTVFVSAIGKTFIYTSDLTSGDLQTIANEDGSDASEAVKQQGRWDTAAEGQRTEQNATEAYFKDRYGM